MRERREVVCRDKGQEVSGKVVKCLQGKREARQGMAGQGREALVPAREASDRGTGRQRGFDFVGRSDGGEAALAALDGPELAGRALKVNEARPKERRQKRSRCQDGAGLGGSPPGPGLGGALYPERPLLSPEVPRANRSASPSFVMPARRSVW